MSATEYYNRSGYPTTGAAGSSSAARSEFELIKTGFGKLPDLSGNGSKIVAVNSGASALEAITTTGTGNGVRATSPTLVTPVLGVATATSINGLGITTTTGTLTIANSKTLTFSNTLTFTGNDSSSVNFGSGGTVAYTSMGLGSFAATTSAALAGVISDETGTGALVFANTPTLVTPILGTPTSGTLTNCDGLPISTGVAGLGSGVATFLATPSSANLRSAVTDETGTGSLVFATSPTLVTPLLGTPTSGTLTNCTGLPVSTGIDGLGSGVATFLATPSSANLRSAVTDETGSGSLVFATSPTLVTPTLGAALGTSLALGHTSLLTDAASVTPPLQVTSNSVNTSRAMISLWEASGNGVTLTFGKSRNATIGSHTVVQSGDNIAILQFEASDGTVMRRAANITAAIDGTPGSGDMPGRLVFSTTADGASSPTERMRIDSSGRVGIGTTSLTAFGLRNLLPITGGTTALAHDTGGAVQPDVTSAAYMYRSRPTTASNSGTPYTVSNLYHFSAIQSTIHADSTVTNQYGFFVESSLSGATNNYGFYGGIASGTGRYNLYMNGTADNYLGGRLGIGATAASNVTLALHKNLTGSTSAYQALVEATILSDVTGDAALFRTNISTQATAFTLTELVHYRAGLNSIGAGSAITTQMGFHARSSLTGATNNYGFRGQIASAANTYNLYMDGTAANYFAGDLTVYGATAIPAGGTAGTGYKFSSTANFGIFFGSGAPTLSAAKGSLYLRSNGSTTNDRAYINTDGGTTWTALTTAA